MEYHMIRRSLSFSIYHEIMHMYREKHNLEERNAGEKDIHSRFWDFANRQIGHVYLVSYTLWE